MLFDKTRAITSLLDGVDDDEDGDGDGVNDDDETKL